MYELLRAGKSYHFVSLPGLTAHLAGMHHVPQLSTGIVLGPTNVRVTLTQRIATRLAPFMHPGTFDWGKPRDANEQLASTIFSVYRRSSCLKGEYVIGQAWIESM
jgi:hypothetical protein